MRIIRDYRHWPDSLKGGVVAIGNFDGLHRGHEAVLARVQAEATRRAVPAVVLCFEPHPRAFFQPESPRLRLMRFAQKAAALRTRGITALLAQRFDAAFAQLSAGAFIRDVLAEGLGAQAVITGEDFVFGRGRGGSAGTLRKAAADGLFAYEAVAPVGNAGEGKFSSSKIREHLRQGELRHVAAMLGRPYAWCRRVVHGDKRGRLLGFPTANFIPPPVLLPRRGVYAVRGGWGGRDGSNGVRAEGVANLGWRPSVGGTRLLLEVHWFDVSADLYGSLQEVAFIEHLRDERRFDGPDALRAQLAADCKQARAILSC